MVVRPQIDVMQQWFFEDLMEGQVLPHGETLVSQDDAAWFESAFADAAIDASAWTDPPREGRGLSEWHVSALGMRMICEVFLHRTACLGAPGIEIVEWPQPVLVGDHLHLDGQISSLRTSRSRPEMGLVGVEFTITNQHGACVMRQGNVILVQRRTPEERA